MNSPGLAALLDELRDLGSEQTLRIYRRHGLEGEALGVKYGDLENFARRLRKQPELAGDLWESGVHEARVLACKIADPAALDRKAVERWVGQLNRVLVSDFSQLVARGPLATELAEAWTGPDQPELVRVAGWFVVAALATRKESVPRDWFEPFLRRIEWELPEAPNQVRYALNEGLIAIGGRNDVHLREEALRLAARIGSVEVDHGETGCKTPDAESYIRKIWERREGRAASQSS